MRTAVRQAPCLALLLGSLHLGALHAQAAGPSPPSPRSTSYRSIDGLTMYYQVYGGGRPLVLLHGGFATIEESFAEQLAFFSSGHLILAPEQQGIGRTRDIDRPLDYVTMADNTAQLLSDLHFPPTDVLGLSDGGIVGLLLAARHPSLVRRLVVVGASTLPLAESFSPEAARDVAFWDPATDSAGMQRYAAHVADSVSHYPIFVAKLKDLWLNHPTAEELGPAVLARVTAPTLVIDGDRESVRLEHTVALWRSLPHAELFIVPGTGHHSIREHPEWINPVIEAFLQKELSAP